MNTTTPTPQDAAAEIIANMRRAFDVNALIEDARTKLGVPHAEQLAASAVDIVGAQAIIANNLLAKADELKRVADVALAEREEIKKVLSDFAGDADVLKINGSPVYTQVEQTARVLDQAAVKAAFPDIPGNERFWKDQTTRPRRFK